MGLRVEFYNMPVGDIWELLFLWTSMVQGKICMPPKVSTRDVKIFLKILSWYISTVPQYIYMFTSISNRESSTVYSRYCFFDLVDYGCIW
jgi:hypothetical protein